MIDSAFSGVELNSRPKRFQKKRPENLCICPENASLIELYLKGEVMSRTKRTCKQCGARIPCQQNKRGRPPKFDHKAAIEMRNRGKTLQFIGKKLGVSHEAVRLAVQKVKT